MFGGCTGAVDRRASAADGCTGAVGCRTKAADGCTRAAHGWSGKPGDCTGNRAAGSRRSSRLEGGAPVSLRDAQKRLDNPEKVITLCILDGGQPPDSDGNGPRDESPFPWRRTGYDRVLK